MNDLRKATITTLEVAELICRQYGIQLVEDFVKVSEYEQMTFDLLPE